MAKIIRPILVVCLQMLLSLVVGGRVELDGHPVLNFEEPNELIPFEPLGV